MKPLPPCPVLNPMLRLLALLLLSLVPLASAQEWTRFHGPNGTGISHAKTIPTKLADADVNWRIELPGVGHSSPVLWGNKLFLTTCDSRSGGVRVLCHDALTGRQLWRHDFKQAPFMPHADWLKNAVHLRRLEKMALELRKLSAGDERERNDD